MKRRTGFSLVELVMVLGVIGVILALLIPALRSGAEAARRCQCLNNLKQVHLALQSYHATHSVYPPGVVDEVRPFSPTDATRRASWTAMLLPMIEQMALNNATNFETAATDPTNATVRRTQINTLLCPDSASDPSPGPIGWGWSGGPIPPEFGRSSYAACHNEVEKAIDVHDHGVFYLNSRVRAADVMDGLSQTILLGEVAAPSADGWFAGGRSTLRNTGTPINGLDLAALGTATESDAWRGSDRTPWALESLAGSGRLTLPAGFVGGLRQPSPRRRRGLRLRRRLGPILAPFHRPGRLPPVGTSRRRGGGGRRCVLKRDAVSRWSNWSWWSRSSAC